MDVNNNTSIPFGSQAAQGRAQLFLCVLLSLQSLVWAGSPYRTDVNPALVYWQVFSQLPELSADERDLFDRRQSAPTDAAYGALVGRYDTAFRLARRAVDLKPRADWGVDLADGPMALLPHLAKAKLLAQAAELRARYFLEHGREDDAVRDLVSAVVLGRQLSTDGVLISTLVQMAIDNIAGYCAAENYHRFSAAGLQRLMEGIDASPAGCTISQCIGTGERSFGMWYRRMIDEIHTAHSGDEAKILTEIRTLLATTIAEETNYAVADKFIRDAGGTAASLLALGKEVDALYDELQAVAALPYEQFGPANARFFQKIEASGNPFARTFFPALQKARDKEFRSLARREMLRAAVQYRSAGEPGLQRVRDPFGTGPFQFRRFVFAGVDRGFELRSAYAGVDEYPEIVIFLERTGAPIRLAGPSAGKPVEVH